MITFGEVRKAVVALVGAVATWAAAVQQDGITAAEWWALVVPVLVALGVYQVKNDV